MIQTLHDIHMPVASHGFVARRITRRSRCLTHWQSVTYKLERPVQWRNPWTGATAMMTSLGAHRRCGGRLGTASRRFQVARPVVRRAAVATPNLTWEAVRSAGPHDLATYTLREGQVPSAAPTSTLPTRKDSINISKKPIVLFRDTNSWCPFCERVWLALEEKGLSYDCIPIELYNKPPWYQELVPTSLVPAISLNKGKEIIWESKDILLALEEKFPGTPALLPAEGEARTKALAFLAEIDAAPLSAAGFAYMTGGRRISRRDPDPDAPPPPSMEQLESEFKSALDWFEKDALARYPDGPYLLGETYSLLDIMCISYMERIGAGLPKFRGLDIRTNPAYPNTAAWYAAMATRPAYQKVRSDDQTLHLLFGRMMGLTTSSSSNGQGDAAAVAAARQEAASAMASNMGGILGDVVDNCGLLRYACNPWGATTRSLNGRPPEVAPAVLSAVRKELRRIQSGLATGTLGPRPDSQIGSALGAVVDNYLRSCWNEVEALQGLSPAAAEQLSATCTLAITRCYADAVEPLPWDPAWLSAPADSPAAAASKAAAEEAAMKVELNRTAILEDIIRKSGLARPNADAYGATYQAFNGYKPKISPALVEAVDDSLKRLCLLLLSGQTGPKPEMREAAAVSTAAMAFFRNRASSPRDMTAAAAEQFRAACDHLLKDIY